MKRMLKKMTFPHLVKRCIKLKCNTRISVANNVFFVKFNLPYRRINKMTAYIAFVFFACIFDTISIGVLNHFTFSIDAYLHR